MIKNILFLFVALHIGVLHGARLKLDRLAAVVYGDDETIVITKSDLERTTIEGRSLSPREWLNQWLLYLDAKKYKLEYSEEDVDRALAAVSSLHWD